MSEYLSNPSYGTSMPAWRRIALATALMLSPACSGNTHAEQAMSVPGAVVSTTEAPVDSVALQDEATVQIRFAETAPDGKDDYVESEANCTATHIGGDYFLTASHCFDDILHAGSGFYDQVYDARSDLPRHVELWQGKNPTDMKMLGETDAVVIDGNNTHVDFALVHASNIKNLPAVSISKSSPQPNKDNFDGFSITGYPQNDNFKKVQANLTYLGSTTGKEFEDQFELAASNRPLLVFGKSVAASGSDEQAAINDLDGVCTPGMSGSSVVDHDGKAVGVLSRDVPVAGYDWPLARKKGWNMAGIKIACIFQPVSNEDVDVYKSKVGHIPNKNEIVYGK